MTERDTLAIMTAIVYTHERRRIDDQDEAVVRSVDIAGDLLDAVNARIRTVRPPVPTTGPTPRPEPTRIPGPGIKRG